jgi:hypothetical protein
MYTENDGHNDCNATWCTLREGEKRCGPNGADDCKRGFYLKWGLNIDSGIGRFNCVKCGELAKHCYLLKDVDCAKDKPVFLNPVTKRCEMCTPST